ncbi:hypothetical protein KY333_01185 [Candidatus Woesearchaeota archaeon]|nr:hypothetical protein [Candidatus Woesearchaeota archaeon]
MVSGRSKAYTEAKPAKDYLATDTSELTSRVKIESSRKAKFNKNKTILTECGARIPVSDIADVLFDIGHSNFTPVMVECFTDKALQNADSDYVVVDIGGQDVISHVRFVLKTSGTKKRTLTAYNPHQKTIETITYSGQRQVVPVHSGKKSK